MRVVLRVALLASCAGAFELNTVRLQRRAAGAVEARISVMMGMPDELHDTPDVPELPEECGPYLTIKGKSINAFGALYGLQSVLLLGPLWWAALTLCEKVCEATGWDEDRVFHDGIGKAWSWLNMAVGGCSPAEVTGKDNLPAPGLPALYVSNHASWFDIPLVAQTIPNSFKFIAADELRDLPLVGQQLTDGAPRGVADVPGLGPHSSSSPPRPPRDPAGGAARVAPGRARPRHRSGWRRERRPTSFLPCLTPCVGLCS